MIRRTCNVYACMCTGRAVRGEGSAMASLKEGGCSVVGGGILESGTSK